MMGDASQLAQSAVPGGSPAMPARPTWIAGGAAAAVGCGILLAEAPLVLVALTVALFVALLLPVAPRIGFYLAYPIFFFLPLDGLRVEGLPVLSSPLNALVLCSAGVGVLHWLLRPRPLPGSRLYLPVALCAAVIVVNMGVRNPAVGVVRLSSLLLAMWPFVLTLLLIRTPQQAGMILRVALGCVVAFAAVWVPLLLAVGGTSAEAQEMARLTSISFAGGSIRLNYLLVLAFASAVPVFTALAWYRGIRPAQRMAYGASGLLVLTALTGSGYAAAPLGAAVGVLVVPALATLVDRRQHSPLAVARIVVVSLFLLGVVSMLLVLTPQGNTILLRVLNPEADYSGAYRLLALQQGIMAFAANPIVGWGPIGEASFVGGYLLGRHSTYVMAAYEYGLVYLIPFLWLLIEMLRAPLILVNRVHRPLDRALLLGIGGSITVILFLGVITEVFDGVIPLSLVWLFIGLATVWRHWLDEDATAILVDARDAGRRIHDE